jgi:hypothetical protein
MPFKQFVLLVIINAAATVLALVIVDKYFKQ